MNELELDQQRVIFVICAAEAGVPGVQFSPLPPLSISSSVTLSALLAQLVGQPVRHWMINDTFSGGRVAAIQVQLEFGLAAFPLCTPGRLVTPVEGRSIVIPVPVYDSFCPYSDGFIQVMRSWSKHLLRWQSEVLDQGEWYQDGEQKVKNILRHAQNLLCWSAEDQGAMERLLWYTLAMPGEFTTTD